MIKYRVNLIDRERKALKSMVSKGKAKATTIQKAHVLLASDEARCMNRRWQRTIWTG